MFTNHIYGVAWAVAMHGEPQIITKIRHRKSRRQERQMQEAEAQMKAWTESLKDMDDDEIMHAYATYYPTGQFLAFLDNLLP